MIAFDTICDLLSEFEMEIFRMIVENKQQGELMIAYNGVFAGNLSIYEISPQAKTVALLSGDYAPEVNVARNKITHLPIECVFEFESIRNITERRDENYNFAHFRDYYSSSECMYVTEKELYRLIEKHPEWEKNIWVEIVNLNKRLMERAKFKNISKIDEIFKRGENVILEFSENSLYNNIALTILKNRYTLCVYDSALQLTNKKDRAIDTSDFPVQMFAEFPENPKIFGKMNYSYNNIYSPEHGFSKWLIENREKLQKELPELYRKILEIMLMSSYKYEIIEGLNARLNQLKNYKSNMFNITDELLLNESDFG